jgi:acyl-CoA synthetase (AMP-forming)/AMP-acid ligase II
MGDAMLMHEITAMGAHKFGERAAVRWDDGVLSFSDLDDSVRRLAGALMTITERGDRVGILAENLAPFVTAYYGVPAAGTALTFLNYRLHPREWVWILNNAEAKVLLIQAKFFESLAPFLSEVPSLKKLVVISDGSAPIDDVTTFEEFLDSAVPAVREDLTEDEIAWVIYTSGTTGFPKGAMLSHKNILTAVISLMVEAEPRPREHSLVAFPLCHVAGFTVPASHLRGGMVILAPSFDPVGWMELVDRFEVTGTSMAPTMLDMVLRHPDVNRYSLSSLETVGYGASAMPVELLRRAIERFGPILQSGFGMTELSGNVLIFRKQHHLRAVEGEENLLASCGVPMSLADVKVVDDDFNECRPGEVGEIVVRSDQVLTGYFRNPEATASSFHQGWFKTGDLARRDEEGFFYIVDRKKDMIISGAENVYSREVEEVIYQHPDVIEAAVIGLPDPQWGEVVSAVVVARPDSGLTAQSVMDFCRDRLGGYKRPRRVFFVDALPRNASGKALKRELRDQFSS